MNIHETRLHIAAQLLAAVYPTAKNQPAASIQQEIDDAVALAQLLIDTNSELTAQRSDPSGRPKV